MRLPTCGTKQSEFIIFYFGLSKSYKLIKLISVASNSQSHSQSNADGPALPQTLLGSLAMSAVIVATVGVVAAVGLVASSTVTNSDAN
jgi:hypothetical protein